MSLQRVLTMARIKNTEHIRNSETSLRMGLCRDHRVEGAGSYMISLGL